MLRAPARRQPLLARSLPTMLATISLLSAALLTPPIEANTVATLTRSHDAAGRTLVTVICTEPIAEGSFRTFPLTDPPRAVVALEGITSSVDAAELWIDDGRVEKIRLIHHPDRVPPELLVALDLTVETARVLELRHEMERLVIVVGTEPASVPTIAPTTATTPSPSPTPEPAPATTTPPPSPTVTQTHQPSPTTTPTPTPTPMSAPTRTPSPEPTEAPSIEPTATAAAEPVSTPVPPPPVGLDSLPTPMAATGNGSRLEKISASNRSDGSTLVRISAGGPLPRGCARHMVVAGEPPRIVVTMRGISAPDLPRTIEFDDVNLRRIRLIHDAETSDGELHMVIQPSRAGVAIGEMRQLGPHLVVVLSPPASPADH